MLLKNIVPRLYQQKIFEKAKLYNTLVVLPTGLGKTTIAIMLASHRLSKYRNSKVIMLSPTKPLCEQHFKSFKEHLDLDEEDFALVLGSITKEKRQDLWKKKVIIATPQTLRNDALSNKKILENVSLLVFDEAHRAVGNYSYVEIANLYLNTAIYPRILALTASPGSDLNKVKEVIKNLHIEHLEIKDESDPDVKPYVHTIETKIIDVKLSNEFERIRKILKEAYKKRVEKLKELNYLHSQMIRKTDLLELQSKLFSKVDTPSKFIAISLVAEALKLSHAIELLESQGVKALFEYFKSLEEQASLKKTMNLKRLIKDLDFRNAYLLVQKMVESNISHPKTEKLIEILRELFSKSKDSKVIIFTQYRDMAFEIKEVLHANNINAEVFIGQQRKKGQGLSQKKQKEVLDKFRAGDFKVLISTSIGEEGLDIPEVDYVIFYEPVPSIIRHIQRRGRTGRHREGKVFILHAKDTIDTSYRWATHHKYKNMKRALLKLRKDLENSRVIKKKEEVEILKSKKEPIKSLTEFLSKGEEKKEIEIGSNVNIKEIIEAKNIKKEPIIFVDTREHKNPVVDHLKSLGAEVIFKQLDVGDFLLSDRLIVEFKKREDFVNSLVDGRLFLQAQKLKFYSKPIIIVEGEEDLYSIRMVHPNAIRGALSSLVIDHGIPIFFTSNPKETASYLYIMARREQFVEKKDTFILHANKPKSMREAQLYLVSSIPNVGPTLAESLLRHFKTVKNIANASLFDLQKIPLLGPKKAKIIFDIFNKKYEDDQKNDS